MARVWAFYAALVGAVLLAWSSSQPPAPLPASAPAEAFSAERAMVDVRQIARAPHPMGSAENRRVRAYLERRLAALGAETEVSSGGAFGETKFLPPGWVTGGTVENLIGVIPGRDRAAPAVALMAHYDSVANSPGAADDASGVAAALEIARALTVNGPPPRDLVLILTDGEEFGLYGAKAFWAEHPLRTRIGAVINMEARGSSGLAFMFETGRENGRTVGVFADHVRRPEANSLSAWVYERMPNGTDFTLPKEAGVQGLNFAFIGRPFDYHSASSTPETLDRGSLQHLGGQALDAARGLLALPGAPEKAEDAVYAGLFGRALVVYPAWGGWIVVLAGAGLLAAAVARARRDGPLPRVSVLKGAGLFLLVVTFTALAIRAAYRVAPVDEHFYQGRMGAAYGLYFASVLPLGAAAALWVLRRAFVDSLRWTLPAAALVLGAVCSLFGGLDAVGTGLATVAAVLSALIGGRAAEPRAAWAGLIGLGLIATVALQALAPQTAFLVGWPVLVAALAATATALGGDRRGWAAAVLAITAVVSIAWVGRTAAFLFDSLGLTAPELLAACAGLAALSGLPLAAAWSQLRLVSVANVALLAVIGIVGLAWIALADPWSARFPRPTHVLHVIDVGTGRSALTSSLDDLDAWTRGVLSKGGEPRRAPLPALWAEETWVSRTKAVTPAAPPRLDVSREGAVVRVRLADPLARELRLSVDPTNGDALRAVSVQGRAWSKPPQPGEPLRVRWQAAGADGVTVAFEAHGPVTLRWAALRDGWPADATPLPPRGDRLMPVGSSDSTVLVGEGRAP